MSIPLTNASSDEVNLSSTLSHERLACILPLGVHPRAHPIGYLCKGLVLLLTTLIRLRSYNYYKDISQRENQTLQSVSLLKTNYTEQRQLQREKDQLQRDIERLDMIIRGSCPHGWRIFNTSCYCSRQDCRERGADLVIVNNEEEQRFINRITAGTEGIWKWVDGTQLTTGYRDGQPNNLGDQDCVEFNSHRSTPLSVCNDKVCSIPLHWICEK
uniref:C-type lectin domain-containing protein n=1 Tax=Salmo trutta TaxID=8032 RepID=A0A673WER0_SALTR